MKHIFFLLCLAIGQHANAALDCLPAEFGGTGVASTFSLIINDAGDIAVGYVCKPNATGTVQRVQSFVHLSQGGPLPNVPASIAAASAMGLDNLNALIAANEWAPPEGTPARATFDGLHNQVRAKAIAKLHPWKVAQYGTQPSRPTYPIIGGGKSVNVAKKRAPVNAPCDCSKPIIMGLVTYCPFQGSADLVTMCVQ